MALDRIHRWGQTKPTKDDLQIILEDFLGGTGKIELVGDRFTATLPGSPSRALKRVGGHGSDSQRTERWFEVWFNEKNIDIITREQDEFTNALAEGFSQLIQRWYSTFPEV